ncbi:hypothetical protein GCM10010297_22530 [Streptomyces malachitofuscus]|nr:hypothetical protein GCM10010297_22530 [Streptomyces malachitofuscus]
MKLLGALVNAATFASLTLLTPSSPAGCSTSAPAWSSALADEPVVLLVLVFVQGGLSFALGSALITRVLIAATTLRTVFVVDRSPEALQRHMRTPVRAAPSFKNCCPAPTDTSHWRTRPVPIQAHRV